MSTLIANLINELHEAMTCDDHTQIWANPGVRDVDAAAAVVADYYMEFPTHRELIRNELREVADLWSLVLFVRRASLLAKTDEGARWLNRGLAVASMIDANCDYRDLIVSLVILRSLAADAGLLTDDAFDAAITWSTNRMSDILRNARNHATSDVRATLATFSPPPSVDFEVRQQLRPHKQW